MLTRSLTLLLVILLSACSWQAAQPWKRSVCKDIVDEQSRADCLAEAELSEKEHKARLPDSPDE